VSGDFRCGYVTIIGRPNVGKSTFINCLLGQKLNITSSKPQTTRWLLNGIKNGPGYQAVFVDTPGLQSKYRDKMNRHMIREIRNSLFHVNVILFMIESLKWFAMDERVLDMIKDLKVPVILLVNKIDRLDNRAELLPFLETVCRKSSFADIIPVSARRDENILDVEKSVVSHLPVAPPQYPEDQLSDRSERFFAAEFIREKLIRQLGEELPYRIAVTIEQFNLKENILHIQAVIWVESESQKRIIVGKNGAVLKTVGEKSRKNMEDMFGHKIFLQTWVKVKKNWTTDARAMKQFGYDQ
jgi:GTP-binding protein Era